MNRDMLERGRLFVMDLLNREGEIGTFEVELELRKARLVFADADDEASDEASEKAFWSGMMSLIDAVEPDARPMRVGLGEPVDAVTMAELQAAADDFAESGD